MSANPIRSNVTTVFQAQGPKLSPHTAIISKEIVPMREEIYTGKDLDDPQKVAGALHKMQRHMNETTQAARSLPFLGGTYWPNIAFTANTAVTMAHGVPGGLPVAWEPYGIRPVAANAAAVTGMRVIEVAQNAQRGTIELASDVSGTVDLFFFVRPGAAR